MAEDRPFVAAVRNGSQRGAPCLIRARGLCKRFQNGGAVVDVLRDLDLDLPPGESIAIIGASGIGKSTLLLQAAMEFAEKGNVLYVSGEESGQQIKCVPSACYPKEMAKK